MKTIALLLMGIVAVFAQPVTAQTTIVVEEVIYFHASASENQDIPILNTSPSLLIAPEMNVYPNPFTTEFTAELETGSGAYRIEILDNEANPVFESSISTLPETFEDVELSPGTYYLNIYTSHGTASETIIRSGE